MDISRAKDILDYWFPSGGKGDYDKWFMKSKDYDAEMKEKFGALLKLAEEGKGMGWLVSKESFVAYIILLDQFSRHIYRGTKDSFKNDNACLLFVKQGFQIYGPELEGYEFMFAFMPYMHTENITYQKKGFDYFHQHKELYGTVLNCERLLTQSINPVYSESTSNQSEYDKEYMMLKSMETHVKGHYETIKLYGRFPKRNNALSRKSTQDEINYMQKPEVIERPY